MFDVSKRTPQENVMQARKEFERGFHTTAKFLAMAALVRMDATNKDRRGLDAKAAIELAEDMLARCEGDFELVDCELCGLAERVHRDELDAGHINPAKLRCADCAARVHFHCMNGMNLKTAANQVRIEKKERS